MAIEAGILCMINDADRVELKDIYPKFDRWIDELRLIISLLIYLLICRFI